MYGPEVEFERSDMMLSSNDQAVGLILFTAEARTQPR